MDVYLAASCWLGLMSLQGLLQRDILSLKLQQHVLIS